MKGTVLAGLAAVVGLLMLSGCGSKDDGPKGAGPKGGGPGGGYTERLLRLDPNQLKRLLNNNDPPKGAAPKYPAGSVADLLQALRIAAGHELKGVTDSTNPFAKYGAGVGVNWPSPAWAKVFGTPENVTTRKARFTNQVWTVRCTDGAVTLVGGIHPQANNGEGLTGVDVANWDEYIPEFCTVR